MPETASQPRHALIRFLASDLILGSLVAFASVMVAFAAYQSNLAGSLQADAYVEGQMVLSLSNTEFLRANQDIIQDYNMFDGSVVHANNPALAAYYEFGFSEPLLASLDRPDGPFDDLYYEEMYVEADASFEEAMALFAEGHTANQRSDQFQLAGLIFAVGLALAAWASILRPESNLRPVFVVLSIVVLGGGLLVLAGIYLLA
jgi:hypothetical protein